METKKIEKNLPYSPNLLNYESEYTTFKWDKFEKELEYFADRKFNAAYNAVDRHTKGERKEKVALYWEDDKGTKKSYTFTEISLLSNKFGNVLKKLGVKRKERVFFFLPRIPELYFGFLGTLKIGAIAGTLFSAFGPQALRDRLENSKAKILVTTPDLFARVKEVWKELPYLKEVIIVGERIEKEENVKYLSDYLQSSSSKLRIARTDENDPAFMLYTSGTTGKPKGIVHAHRAIFQEYLTAKWVLDIKDSDIYWCTADPGWVTGIAYEILGSWACGSTTVVYSGRFEPEKWYQILQDYKVTIWYTAPTAVRMLAAAGLELVEKYNFSSLRHLASVGEPLNPEAVYWGQKAFGLPFHDNYWQTETGGIVIANYPALPIKPGSMGKPFPGVIAEIVNEDGKDIGIKEIGNLVLKPNWRSMMLKVWARPSKFKSYFNKGWYYTGDLAFKDEDNYFWFVGRADDVIKTSGERVGPFEVESALIEHHDVIEAGVIGKPDPIRGEIIKAFVVLKPSGIEKIKSDEGKKTLSEELITFVKKHLAGHAAPKEIEFIDKLPKTRSGKIMRRMLKAKELCLPLGDTSTLEEF